MAERGGERDPAYGMEEEGGDQKEEEEKGECKKGGAKSFRVGWIPRSPPLLLFIEAAAAGRLSIGRKDRKSFCVHISRRERVSCSFIDISESV